MKRKSLSILLTILLIFAIGVPVLTISTGCGGGNPVQVVTGFAHTIVLREDGTVWGWGRNEEGQLGNGNRNNQFRPVRFRLEEFQGYAPPERVVQVASHKIHTMALGDDGSVWAGGWNQEGQLGAPVGCRLIPLRVPFPVGTGRIVDIDAGMLFSIALSENGYVYGWGRNRHEIMGSFTNINDLARATRIQGYELRNITQISAGHEHVLALRNDGVVLAWGRNRNGQVGPHVYLPGQGGPPGRPTSEVGLPVPVEFPITKLLIKYRQL